MEEGTVTEAGDTNEVTHVETTPADWKSSLGDVDLQNNPGLQKYNSVGDLAKGYLSLQQNLGKDKVVWPKDENDTEAWAEVNSRMGVPEKADGYNLEAIANPDDAELFNKAAFQEIMKETNAPKRVAEGLWKSYTGAISSKYAEANAQFESKVEEGRAELMKEWGAAYETKIKGGDAVIDTLSNSQAQKDNLTVALSQSTDGLRFLADIHNMMKESSIGGFQEKSSFTLTPTEAQSQLDTIKANPDYRSDDIRVRQPLIDRVQALRKMATPGN